jgi:multidrug efflux pump subunit AcrB
LEGVANKELPRQYSYEWTDLAFQEKAASGLAFLVFPLCILFVWLTHSAEYESFALSTAIVLIVPMCLLCGITAVWVRHMDNNIFTQIGFVVLAGMSVKNAVLIVEFAKQQQESHRGMKAMVAAMEAARLRLRPILMTSLAFIFGVIPLIIATGAGRNETGSRHGRVLRHDRREVLRSVPHSRLLYRNPSLDWPSVGICGEASQKHHSHFNYRR